MVEVCGAVGVWLQDMLGLVDDWGCLGVVLEA